MNTLARTITCACCVLIAACAGEKPAETAPAEPAAAAPAIAGPKQDFGVDLATKTLRLGVLNDETGPAAAIGKPYAVGKRVLAAQINAGGSGLLPEGWKIALVEKDHGYNPQKSVAAYNELKADVMLIAHSFGTPNTTPLRPMLERDRMIALPASLASQMSQHRATIPVAPSYEIEAMRALDFALAMPPAAGKKPLPPKPAIVYQRDDYGQDGLLGWKRAAEHHGVAIAAEQSVLPGQRDFAPVVAALKQAGATHVMLTVLPSATAPLLAEAAKQRYRPVWLGQSPSWIDAFFASAAVPPEQFANYYWVSAQPYWGENLPGMQEFLAAYDKYGKSQTPPDYYVISSYVQGLLAVEIARRAIEANDLTRAGLLAVVPQITAFDAGGLSQPVDLSRFPYATSTRTRVLKPDFAKQTWTVAADYADPSALKGTGSKAAAAQSPRDQLAAQ